MTTPSSTARKKISIFIVLGILTALFFILDLGHYLSIDNLKARQADLLAWRDGHGAMLAGGFVLIYALQTGLSLPGAAILSLAAGALFGVAWGAVIVNVGATTGATLAFIASRYLLRSVIERRFGERMARLSEGFAGDGVKYLLFLRLVPVFPFWLINLAAALTRIPLSKYILATAVGIIPGSVVFCYAGSQLAEIDSLSDVMSPGILVALGLLGGLALVPMIVNRLKASATTSSEGP